MIHLPLILGLLACKAPVEAPAELDVLSAWLYREWSSDDLDVPAAGLASLDAFLVDVDLSPATPLDDRAWTLADLVDEDVADLPERPDVPLDGAFGSGVAYASAWPVDCHATVQIQADQTPFEPSAPEYVRTFLSPTDPSCFPSAACERLDSKNDVRRKNLLISVAFELWKSWRWFTYTDGAGVERQAFYSRSWLAKSWDGDSGRTRMVQSYSIDVYLPRDDGRTWRYQTLWSETDLGASVDEDLQLGVIKGGTDDILRGGDDAIEEAGICTPDRRVPVDQ